MDDLKDQEPKCENEKSHHKSFVDFEVPKKIDWFYAPIFIAFWLILYRALVVTQVNHLPNPLNIRDEATNTDAFISERALLSLQKLTNIGPRVVGNVANEVTTVNFLLNEIRQVREQASDYYNFEVDVQQATGNYVHWSMINMYQGIQNVVVKLSARDSTSENYVLLNSHYDTVPGSSGGGDDGSMVAVMLEVMRVISKTERPLKNPIVFLFNGAEENPLQASHAFITQHKWAKKCKALINLDAAGNGGREILFQSGPNHPWLMSYYRGVPHPFANTLGEEMFQGGLIPSDTDFRIFRDYGGVPGLDLAYIFNGYVYHTEFDRFNIVPKGSLQHTGDNVLYLAKAIANAPEMDNTFLYEEGQCVFFDFLGWFIIYYTVDTSVIINFVVSAAALVTIGVSLFFMSARSGLSWNQVLKRFAICFVIQIVSWALGTGLALLVAVFMDGVGQPLTWFSQNWLIIGLFFCPMWFGMVILPALYVEKTKNDCLGLGFRIQLFLHSHCLCLIILTIATTAMGRRSSFMVMLAVFFDIVALIINLVTKWHRKAYWFAITVIICQILPFLQFTSNTLTAYYTMIPMMGRSGSDTNPDLLIAGIAILMSILFAGFLLPLFLFFRKTRTIILFFFGVTLLFIIIAVTPAGFPYAPKTATQRYSVIHSHRILHDAQNNDRVNEAGILVFPQDRRIENADEYINLVGEKHRLSEYCDNEMFCGMPLFNHRWHKSRERSFWIPVSELPSIPDDYPRLVINESETTADVRRFNCRLSGPDHMTLFIEPKNEAKVISWSFNDTMLRENWTTPYFIYFSYGKDNSSLDFTIDVQKSTGDFKTPSLEIGVGGHYIHQQRARSNLFTANVYFPDYWSVQDWVATYESWLF